MVFKKPNLIIQIIIAIILGIVAGFTFPDFISRVFITFNGLFGNFLGFIVPLIILGLIVPGITAMGKQSGKLLLITACLAYLFTLFSGFFTYGVMSVVEPILLKGESIKSLEEKVTTLLPYFTVEMTPILGVMSALIFAFMMGIGITVVKGNALNSIFEEFREIVMKCINRIIIPLLPIYIFGIFMSMTITGEVASVLSVFVKLILVIFVLTALLLILQYSVAGAVVKRNPFKMLWGVIPAYFTALGTQSSAATIPVTLAQTIKIGVRPSVASFVIPLCATIHLSGSTMKIVACAMAVIILNGGVIDIAVMSGFIMTLGITMVAAPGVPGGAIMAALGILASILGFDDQMLGLMVALYIAMDSFGTATNVAGDGAIASIVDKIAK